MKQICCECGKTYGEKPGQGETHGYCPDCEKAIRKKYGLPAREPAGPKRPITALLEQATANIEAAIEILDQLVLKVPRGSLAGRALVRSKAEARRAQTMIQMDWLDLQHNQKAV